MIDKILLQLLLPFSFDGNDSTACDDSYIQFEGINLLRLGGLEPVLVGGATSRTAFLITVEKNITYWRKRLGRQSCNQKRNTYLRSRRIGTCCSSPIRP